jgi:hypothetical protein
MAMITNFTNRAYEDVPMVQIGGSAAPKKLQKYYLNFDAASGDSLEMSAVNSNISKIVGVNSVMVGSTLTLGGGTAVTVPTGGTGLTTTLAGNFQVVLTASLN